MTTIEKRLRTLESRAPRNLSNKAMPDLSRLSDDELLFLKAVKQKAKDGNLSSLTQGELDTLGRISKTLLLDREHKQA